MLYRIYTERKNKKFIYQLVSEHFKGFTVFNTIGYWQGERERGLCIEIISNGAEASDRFKLNIIIKSINGYNKQDCCLLTKQEVESELI